MGLGVDLGLFHDDNDGVDDDDNADDDEDYDDDNCGRDTCTLWGVRRREELVRAYLCHLCLSVLLSYLNTRTCTSYFYALLVYLYGGGRG